MNQLTKLIFLLCALVATSLAAPVEANGDNLMTNPAGTQHIAKVTTPETPQSANEDVDDEHDADLVVPDTNELANRGQATYYQAGLGACGTTNNGATQDIVALPHGLMGPQSNGNPFCGRRVSISYKGKQATGVVQDKCMGCAGHNIDLSVHLFKQLAPLSAGRISGVEWHFV